MDFSRILIGRRLANEEGQARKITAIEGVPAMGLDGLGSSAYGPEAALTVLIPLNAEGLHLIRPIMAAILFLLALLYFSYRQTIEAYPSTGGSYIVAKDNLGANAGLLAGSALMIDYVFNVAVGISAGIGALTSAIRSFTRTLSNCAWQCEDVERPARSAGSTPPKLVISPSPYRSFVGRLLKHVAEIETQHPDRPMAVVVPEVVEEHWWDYVLLNNFRTRRLCATLMRHGGPNLAVVLVPWAYEPPRPRRSHRR